VVSAAAARRRGSANNARIAAKQRRQKILVVVLAAVLVALLAFQLPKVFDRFGRGSTAVPAAPAVSSPEPVSEPRGERLAGPGNGADPFAVVSLPNGDARAVSGGGPDPFTGRSAASSSTAAPAAALPRRIVIARGRGAAKRGWIVVLASIPTRNGRGAALRFAREARSDVGALSVLNSSIRRPLRGGYWVVYAGPYATQQKAARRAGKIHSAGYQAAYTRELIR
jgi:hypothetical protein